MCCVNECKSTSSIVNNSGGWGLSGSGICTDHWNEFATGIEHKPDNPQVKISQDPNFLADYIRLTALMLDVVTVDAVVAKLEKQIVAARLAAPKGDERFNGKKYKSYVRLSRVLKCYEGFCWFPSTDLVYAGAVSAADFQGNLAKGYMPKDPGGGYLHGDFSHRLQWHVVMRVVTNGFADPRRSGWDHSALELFTSFGSTQATNRGLWGYIFDRQNTRKYQDPGTLNDAVRKNDNLLLLQDTLNRRYDKRDIVEKDIYLYLVKKKQIDIPTADIAAVLYRWSKTGGKPQILNGKAEEIASELWSDSLKDKERDYETTAFDGVLKKTTDELVSSQSIQQRITCSRNSLNTIDFAYNDAIGASHRHVKAESSGFFPFFKKRRP